MCIYATIVLTVSTLTGCSASTGTVTTMARTKVSREEVSRAEAAKKETIRTSEASKEVGDIASEEVQTAVEKHHVKINVKDYGTISVELYGDGAPITVANFLKLAKDGFYGGLTFHHIINGFMIRGDNPLGIGMGGSDQEIKDEFSNNGVEDPLSHTRGAISMTRSQIKDDADSQLFIVHEGSAFLNGDYACFGYVIEGMKVVDAICEDTKVEDSNSSVAKANQLVTEGIEVVDW